MAGTTPIPDLTQVELVRLSATAHEITAVVRAHAPSNRCPVCGMPSTRLHFRYVRQVVDRLSEVGWAQWLCQHPHVRLICRDRGGDYAAGAILGVPYAQQIADRFHLLVNA